MGAEMIAYDDLLDQRRRIQWQVNNPGGRTQQEIANLTADLQLLNSQIANLEMSAITDLEEDL